MVCAVCCGGSFTVWFMENERTSGTCRSSTFTADSHVLSAWRMLVKHAKRRIVKPNLHVRLYKEA